MKVGFAAPSMSNGWIISQTSQKFSPDWSLIRDTAVAADSLGFDFSLCTVQLRGMDGPTRHFHETADSKNIFFSTDAFMIGFPVIAGSPRKVADKMHELAKVDGLGGFLVVVPEYPNDIVRFGRDVIPLLEDDRVVSEPAPSGAGA